ncbi:MAG: hypothetical protein ACI9DJ_002295 [Algoriphagus sp.]|jgi:hypothetical protein
MTDKRENPIELSKKEFQKNGHELIDRISDFFDVIS